MGGKVRVGGEEKGRLPHKKKSVSRLLGILAHFIVLLASTIFFLAMLWRILNFDWASAIFCPKLAGHFFVSLSPSLSLSLWSLVSRYLIAAGKCFQVTRSSGSLIFTFNFQNISSNSLKKIWYLFGNFDFCTEVESRRSRSYSEYWAVQGWYSGNRPRDSRFEYAQARRIRSLRGQIVF